MGSSARVAGTINKEEEKSSFQSFLHKEKEDSSKPAAIKPTFKGKLNLTKTGAND